MLSPLYGKYVYIYRAKRQRDTEPNNLTPFPEIRSLLIYISYTNCTNVDMKIKFPSLCVAPVGLLRIM